jgi:hypothetical protein
LQHNNASSALCKVVGELNVKKEGGFIKAVSVYLEMPRFGRIWTFVPTEYGDSGFDRRSIDEVGIMSMALIADHPRAPGKKGYLERPSEA